MNPPESDKSDEHDRKYSEREIERAANSLRSIADQLSSGNHTVYGCLYNELLGLRDEITGLPGIIIPIIEDAIRLKS